MQIYWLKQLIALCYKSLEQNGQINEILEHKTKILKLSGFNEIQFQQTYQLVIDKIQFIDDILLSDNDIAKAEELVKDIDDNDLLFVALNNHLHSVLWTGETIRWT